MAPHHLSATHVMTSQSQHAAPVLTGQTVLSIMGGEGGEGGADSAQKELTGTTGQPSVGQL